MTEKLNINWKTIGAVIAAVIGGFSANGYINPNKIETRLDSIENRLTAIETKLSIVLTSNKSVAEVNQSLKLASKIIK